MDESLLTLALERECLEPFEIHVGHVLKTVSQPDQTDTVWQGDLALRVHLKRIEPSHLPEFLLVIEKVQGAERQVTIALKVYPDLCEGIGAISPLEVLTAIANRFGVVVRIGQKQSLFFLEESIPTTGPGDIEVLGESTERAQRNRLPQIFCRIDPGSPAMANCALGFCLDKVKYKAWLRTHKRPWRR